MYGYNIWISIYVLKKMKVMAIWTNNEQITSLVLFKLLIFVAQQYTMCTNPIKPISQSSSQFHGPTAHRASVQAHAESTQVKAPLLHPCTKSPPSVPGSPVAIEPQAPTTISSPTSIPLSSRLLNKPHQTALTLPLCSRKLLIAEQIPTNANGAGTKQAAN